MALLCFLRIIWMSCRVSPEWAPWVCWPLPISSDQPLGNFKLHTDWKGPKGEATECINDSSIPTLPQGGPDLEIKLWAKWINEQQQQPFLQLEESSLVLETVNVSFQTRPLSKKMWIVRWSTSNHLKTIRGWDSCFESMPLTGPCVLNIQWWKKRSSWAVKTTPLSHLNG